MFDLFCSFERDEFMSHLYPTLDYSELKDTDVVIEAVFEDLKLKHKVIEELEKVCFHFMFFQNVF